jgi:hypothetical protein
MEISIIQIAETGFRKPPDSAMVRIKSRTRIDCMGKRSSDPASLGLSAGGRIRTSVKRLIIPAAFRTGQAAGWQRKRGRGCADA